MFDALMGPYSQLNTELIIADDSRPQMGETVGGPIEVFWCNSTHHVPKFAEHGVLTT